MFYIPRLIWQLICYNKTGANLESLIADANSANTDPPKERKSKVDIIGKTIENMLFQHRDYRQGKMAKIRRELFRICNLCVFSKHMGTWLVLSYMLIKVLYGVNAIGQLFIMKSFLGFNSSIPLFGYTILSNLINGIESNRNGIFPTVTYCYLNNIQHLGGGNKYVAQCALPINMLNEKLYVVLWFWVLFVGIITALSLPIWFIRIAFLNNRNSFIKRFLLIYNSYDKSEKELLNCFVQQFLRHDGVFLIRMIFINAGDLIAGDIVNGLWEIYKKKYYNVDFGNYSKKVKVSDIGTSSKFSNKISFSYDTLKKKSTVNLV